MPLDSSENSIVTRLAENYYKTCEAEAQSGKTAWIGITPNALGRWQVLKKCSSSIKSFFRPSGFFGKDMNTAEPVPYSNWKPGSGSGNCAYIITGEKNINGMWGDSFCSDQSPRRVCTICEFEGQQQFYSLRGLCTESRHDREFSIVKDGDNKPFLKGLSSSIITWVSCLASSAIFDCTKFVCAELHCKVLALEPLALPSGGFFLRRDGEKLPFWSNEMEGVRQKVRQFHGQRHRLDHQYLL